MQTGPGLPSEDNIWLSVLPRLSVTVIGLLPQPYCNCFFKRFPVPSSGIGRRSYLDAHIFCQCSWWSKARIEDDFGSNVRLFFIQVVGCATLVDKYFFSFRHSDKTLRIPDRALSLLHFVIPARNSQPPTFVDTRFAQRLNSRIITYGLVEKTPFQARAMELQIPRTYIFLQDVMSLPGTVFRSSNGRMYRENPVS